MACELFLNKAVKREKRRGGWWRSGVGGPSGHFLLSGLAVVRIMGVLEPVPQSMGLGTRASQQPGSEEAYPQEYFCLSLPGVFITHGDVGVGTIVGSAVFNILCIIGVCGLFAGQVGVFLPL